MQGCDVLCVNLVDRTAPYRYHPDAARNENIPVIFFNREPVKEDLMQWDQAVLCRAVMRKQSGINAGRDRSRIYLNSSSGSRQK